MTSRMTSYMTDDVSKRINMSILSEVMLAVIQRGFLYSHSHARSLTLFFQFMNSEIT